ncbi:DNA polymerase III subunit beta, partial [Candidatus Microgenomates bacterium]|nr:DNA polymerase III subunit beta [Candidatus Microgenomates bacterium]
MKLSVIQENLKNSLNLCSHFISPKAQLPILGNIKLVATKSKLILTSTNLETSVSTSIGAKVDKEGEITVPGRVITDIISGLSAGNVSLEVRKERITIESGSFRSTIAGMNTSDFPKVPSIVSKSNLVTLDRKLFIDSLSKCQFAVSSDETRPVLTGVLFKFSGNTLHLVATDGFRLSQVSMGVGNKVDIDKLIVPRAVLSEIIKSTGEGNIEFSYNEKDNQVLFGVEDSIFSSRVIEGEFPDFEKIIPGKALYKVSVDKHELGQAIRLASVFARES